MSKNRKFENPNGGFFTPMIPVWIILGLVGIGGLVYAIVQYF